MLIEIYCHNLVSDPASGQRIECGESLIVPSEKMGEFVHCKRCNCQVEISETTARKPQVWEAEKSKPTSSNPDSKQKRTDVLVSTDSPRKATGKRKPAARKSAQAGEDRSSVTRSKKSSRSDAGSTSKPKAKPSQKSVTTAKDGARKPRRKKVAQPESRQGNSGNRANKGRGSFGKVKVPLNALGEMRLPDNSKDKNKIQVDAEAEEIADIYADRPRETVLKCSKCRALCVYGRCPECQHIMAPYDRLYVPLTEIEIQPAGFQRWFLRTISDSTNIRPLIGAGHMIVTMFVILLIALGVAFLNGYYFGRDVGIGVLVFAGLFAIYYLLFVIKGKRFLSRPAIRLNWMQRPLWNSVLTLARLFRWQGYDKSLKGRKIIKIKDRSFDDRRLAEIDLNQCEVLDLQRTSVTNEALKLICGMKNLRCLVLRKTQVTNEGAYRIQQAKPNVWIWH
ncbi:MAG: hypothetical protein AAF939_20220 [Planctomycetota bacterium]